MKIIAAALLGLASQELPPIPPDPEVTISSDMPEALVSPAGTDFSWKVRCKTDPMDDRRSW